jgi:peptidase M28-like protein
MNFNLTAVPLRSVLLFVLLATSAADQIHFRKADRSLIESRLKNFAKNNDEREAGIKQLFAESGCKDGQLSEQIVKKNLPPNVICVLPGQTDEVILVGAHTDKVDAGDGVVDNWSGASLLPSLLYSLSATPRRHTFIFVGFTGEERGLLGSDFYAHKLTKEERSKIQGMVNFDTLGLGPTKVWASHADKQLLDALGDIAGALQLPIGVVNVDKLGSADSESFAPFKIPRITIHSVTQETWPILHSKRDKLDVVNMDDYYSTYCLMAGYLAFLDTYLEEPTAPETKSGH